MFCSTGVGNPWIHCPRGASGTCFPADPLLETQWASCGRNWGFRLSDLSGARSRHGEGVCVLRGRDMLLRGHLDALGHCPLPPPGLSHDAPGRRQPCWRRGPGAVNLGRGSRRWRLGRTGSAPAWDVQEGRGCRCPCCEDSYLSSSVHALDGAASVLRQGGWQGAPARGHPGLHTRSPQPAPCPPAQEDPGQPVRGPAGRSRRGGGASSTQLPESSQPDPESSNPGGAQSPALLTPEPVLASPPR